MARMGLGLRMPDYSSFIRSVRIRYLSGLLIFALATGRVPIANVAFDIAEIGAAGAAVMARAIARGLYEATPAPGDTVPTWRQRFG